MASKAIDDPKNRTRPSRKGRGDAAADAAAEEERETIEQVQRAYL